MAFGIREVAEQAAFEAWKKEEEEKTARKAKEYRRAEKNEPRPTLLTEEGRARDVEPVAEPITGIGVEEEQIPTVLGKEISDEEALENIRTVIGKLE